MSQRAFTVFQDAPATEPLQPRALRSNVMALRSSTRNVVPQTPATELAHLDKENYDPATGERSGPSSLAGKKRKTVVLAAKVQPPSETSSSKSSKKDKDSQPEQKKRKASTSGTAATSKSKAVKKDVKVTGLSKKPTKRAGSRRAPSLPRLKEEEENAKAPVTQEEIDSRCRDLTVRPLADVSEAYDELSVFGEIAPSTTPELAQLEDKPRLRTVKAASVEPEIRDYFEPSHSLMSSTATTTTRIRAASEDAPEPRSFSTPERKRIYAAFTFSSPAASFSSSGPLSKPSSSGAATPDNQLA